MRSKKFTQQQAKEMHQLLTEIYSGLRDKNGNKKFADIPFIEVAWLMAIEKHLPEAPKFIQKYFRKKEQL